MEAERIRKDILLLWQRYQDLAKQVYALQATMAELSADMEKMSKTLTALYHKSDDETNGA